MRKSLHLTRALTLLSLAGVLSGCAQLPGKGGETASAAGPATPVATGAAATAAAPKPAAAAPASAAAAAPPPRALAAAPAASAAASPPAMPTGGPPPFATVVKDARRIDGPIVLWQKDEKVWIELLPNQLGQPFLLSPKIKSGIGEAWVLGGLMAFPINGAGGVQVIEFVRVHNQIRLQARNTDVMARAGTPEARAVADAYSNSLLGATAVASQPHPDRKSILVEANPLFLNDVMGVGMMLQRGLRQGYGLDRGNSVITAARGTTMATTLETQLHFYTGNVIGQVFGAPPGAPVPQVPRYLPDARSMLVTVNYSIAALPEVPMQPRRADPRVGLFTSTVLDFSDDLTLSPRQRYVNRWRLEKKDPAAEMSEPVKPITFWIDRNVPLAYRETVRAAVLEWNKAFEKIGISGAIRVEQQPDDAKFDTLDFGHASVRWMVNADPVFGAIGPSHVDPRTGEILDADIAFEGMSSRNIRGLRSQVLGSAAGMAQAPGAFAVPFEPPADLAAAQQQALQREGGMPPEMMRCMHGALAAEQLGYALDVLQARGELEPDSPLAQQFVQDYIKESIMHEVGHALGLRHNFRASRAYTEAQLADAEFTRAYGTTGSVMEYNAVNLPLPGKTGGVPFQTTLGPYDYWAIEYAYKPMPPGTKPEAERAELQKVAARNNEPLLAFGTDEDIFFGLDPETIQLDLGSDPVAFAAKRIEIARDLFRRQEKRAMSPQRDYAVLRRSLGYALNDVARAVGVLARQIGGVRTLRDFPGSGRDPLQPVPAEVQRQSLDLMMRAVLSADGLTLPPAMQRRLAPDYLDRADLIGDGSTDFALPQRLLDLQRAVLGYLMSEGVAARVLDSAGKVDRGGDAFQLGEIYQRLSDDVWGELGRRGSVAADGIPAERRELQRNYVNRLALLLVRPSPFARTDSRGLVRTQARTLLARIESALSARGKAALPEGDTRAHLVDSADTLRQALASSIQRQSL